MQITTNETPKYDESLVPLSPWFGGKRNVATEVWRRFGDVRVYSEPFYGMGGVHLARPSHHVNQHEVICDINFYIANYVRALRDNPRAVAHFADSPINHADLIARHRWLVGAEWPTPDVPAEYASPELRAAYLAGYYGKWNPLDCDAFRFRIANDPDYSDPRVAGWWLWGQSQWMGGGWCFLPFKTNKRPQDGKLSLDADDPVGSVPGMKNQRPKLGRLEGIHQFRKHGTLLDYCLRVGGRLEFVRVTNNNWQQAVRTEMIESFNKGPYGVFLDPPYGDVGRDVKLYAAESVTVAADVLAWCVENGKKPQYRIALCGYDVEHAELEQMGWSVYTWKANGGIGSLRRDGTNENANRERIWFSPACLSQDAELQNNMQGRLF